MEITVNRNRYVTQILGEEKLVVYFGRRASGDANELSKFTSIEPHRTFREIQADRTGSSSHLSHERKPFFAWEAQGNFINPKRKLMSEFENI